MNNNIANVTDIKTFIMGKIPAPSVAASAIDTSDVTLLDFRADDADIAGVCNDMGWQRIRLIDDNNTVIPNGRLELTFKSGKKVKIVPFFPLVLLAKAATLKLTTESAMSAWAALGSMKSRNSYKFVASQEQLDAMQAKAAANYDIQVQTTTNAFITWLGECKPTIEQLEPLYLAYNAHATLVVLGEAVYIRQVILATDTDTLPLASEWLQQANKPTSDKIGDITISKAYTFALLKEPIAA